MTEWDVETLEDFEGTFFDDGTGWKLVFQIHMGISIRAKITQHPIRIGNFATQVSGLVWTGDYEVFGFKDLPTRLRDCYAAIESLLSSDENIRWTEASGRSPEWTIESMIADIGMGEFEPLIRPQAPEPFVWLIAALNRLTHPKLKRPLTMQQLSLDPGDPAWGVPARHFRILGPDEVVNNYDASIGGDYEALWDDMAYHAGWFYEEEASLSWALLWGIYGDIFHYANAVAINKTKYISLIAKRDTGEVLASNEQWFRYIKPSITQVDYVCGLLKTNYTGPHWSLTIGTSEPFDTTPIPYGGFIVESDGPDLDFEGTKTIEINLLTERPDSPPFTLYAGANLGSIRVLLREAWIYCDLPEVMGVGELSAPIPTASGEAEWEE